MVVGEDDAHHVEDELADIETRPQMALTDGELDGAAQLPLEPCEMLDHRVAHRPGPVVELHCRRLHRAAVRQAAARGPVEPVVEQRAQRGSPRRAFKAGRNTVSVKQRRSGLDGGHLQFLARSEMGKQPALGQAGAVRPASRSSATRNRSRWPAPVQPRGSPPVCRRLYS